MIFVMLEFKIQVQFIKMLQWLIFHNNADKRRGVLGGGAC